MIDRNPEQVAWDEAKGAGLTLVRWAMDHGRRFLSASLLKFGVVGIVGVVLAWISLPVAAAALCTVAVVPGLIYGIYGRRLYYDERASRRWTWIAAKRLEQRRLRAEQSVDAAIFALAARSLPQEIKHVHVPQELRQAAAVMRQRTVGSGVGELLQGNRGQNARPTPAVPDLAPVAARMQARQAAMDALDTEIEALAIPENQDAAIAADDARNHAVSAAESARKADQLARERVRKGQTATQPEPGLTMQMQVGPTGVRSVSSSDRGPATPEQLAAGERERSADQEMPK